MKEIIIFFQEPKPVVVDGPTIDEIKHKEMVAARAKAWEEVADIGK